MIALIIFPFPTALIYLVPRGREWRSARRREVRQAQADTESYSASGWEGSPAEQIATAESLLDQDDQAARIRSTQGRRTRVTAAVLRVHCCRHRRRLAEERSVRGSG